MYFYSFCLYLSNPKKIHTSLLLDGYFLAVFFSGRNEWTVGTDFFLASRLEDQARMRAVSREDSHGRAGEKEQQQKRCRENPEISWSRIRRLFVFIRQTSGEWRRRRRLHGMLIMCKAREKQRMLNVHRKFSTWKEWWMERTNTKKEIFLEDRRDYVRFKEFKNK